MSSQNFSRHQCPECGRTKTYSYRWDAFLCEHCRIWLDTHCDDPLCIFCQARPEHPPQSKNIVTPEQRVKYTPD